MASLCRLLPKASDVHPMSAPLVASRRPCDAVPNLIPASSGSGVLARLPTATFPLSVSHNLMPIRSQPGSEPNVLVMEPKRLHPNTPQGLNHKLRACCKTGGVSPGVG